MQINTKKEAKTAVSALRRELKNLGKAPDQLSHADCLTLLAKALGYASWNAWEAKLTDDVPAVEAAPSRYPLKNDDGRFNFVANGKPGTPYSSWFFPLQGTDELIPGVALIQSAWRDGSGLKVQYAGSTNVDWDGQKTVRKNGEACWVDCDGDIVLQSQVVLLPEGYGAEEPSTVYEDEAEVLPLREALIAEFVEYFGTSSAADQLAKALTYPARDKVIEAAQNLLGFQLTQREEQEVLRRVVK